MYLSTLTPIIENGGTAAIIIVFILRRFLERNKEIEGSIEEQRKSFLAREDLLREESSRREGIPREEFERNKGDTLKIISEFSQTMVNVSKTMGEIKGTLSEMNVRMSKIEVKIETNTEVNVL